VHTQVDFIRERKGCSWSSTAEPGNRWLCAEVKAEAFYGHFNSGLRKGLGGLFPLVVDMCTQALFYEVVCLPLMGGSGKQP
jgi:hypothetical protein